ncbi:hypothetical protein CAC42_7253 [Sphaceloma murrayae]|uniref:Uncharacterized protein n=1 Tax=Sphaceloma murrayae TaxID=2082308 RepID=A0A2K1QQE9_9PEZI|nr:hypothetical protein CAC42_7253 [Sphaceloma murrayae]
MSVDDLRTIVAKLVGIVQDTKTTAAHFKLQHQMSQMESGEAVERMAVEMEMARREIEVMQEAETQRRAKHDKALLVQQEPDPNYRPIHNDVYAAMTTDLRELKLHNVQLERELGHARLVLEHQESEIASLNDKVLLMRDRIRESRDQLLRHRRMGIDTTPRTTRTTPYQTPVRERFIHLDPAQSQQQQQPGFAALLQATDIVSQGGRAADGEHRKGHSRGTHSLSSMPSTPQRSTAPGHHTLYTPQPPRHVPMEAPMTAPVPRKRTLDDLTLTRPHSQKRQYESDGTVSAADDSEAETELADGDVGDRPASQMASEMLRTPTAKRAKSAHNLKGMTQTRLFGPVTKASVPRNEQSKTSQAEQARTQDVGLGIADTRSRVTQENPV